MKPVFVFSGNWTIKLLCSKRYRDHGMDCRMFFRKEFSHLLENLECFSYDDNITSILSTIVCLS